MARAEAEGCTVSHLGVKAGREACALSAAVAQRAPGRRGAPRHTPTVPITQFALLSSQSCCNGPHSVPLAARFLPARPG